MDKNESNPASQPSTRREFLKKASTVAAAAATANLLTACKTTTSSKTVTPVYGQHQAPSPGRVIGANDRISVAVIGVGVGIGQNHLKGIYSHAAKNNTVIGAACDLFDKRRAFAVKEAELKEADVYTDYRRVLDRKDIDSVVIATHDIWHAPIAIQAMETGKHIYCEKPMSRYLGEAFAVYDKVKSTGRTFQIGAQGCSMPAWAKAAEMIKKGDIGTLVWSQGYYCRNSTTGEWNAPPFNIDADSSAKSIDWATWQGQVKNKQPFSAEYFHRWRKFYPYCAGVLGDLVPHRLHPLMLASGTPEFPSRVVSLGSANIHEDKGTPDALPRQNPEHQQLLAEFPSGYIITLTAGTVAAKTPGFVLYGHKATLNMGEGGNRVDLVPEKPFSDEIDPVTVEGLVVEDADIRMHEKNFFDCIRSGKPTNTNIDLAVRVQTVISLAEMSNRLNIMCLFDEKTRTITTGDGRKIAAITYGTMAES